MSDRPPSVDPLTALRLPPTPLAPRATFAAELRARLLRALHPDTDDSPSTATTRGEPVMSTTAASTTAAPSTTATATATAAARPGVPPGASRLTPYLMVRDARAAVAWYSEVFGAIESGPRYVADDGRIGHASLRIGEADLFLSDPHDIGGVVDPLTAGLRTESLHLYVENCDSVTERAVARGATLEQPPTDQPYGDRSSVVIDPFGYRWMVASNLSVASHDEINQAVADGGFHLEAPPTVAGPEAEEPAPAAPAGTGELFYFTLASPDLDRSAAFFAQLLGWQLERGASGGYHIASTAQPGGLAGGADRPAAALYFRVPDLDAAVARVHELGGEVDEPVGYASGRSVSGRDPVGVPFNLSEPAPRF